MKAKKPVGQNKTVWVSKDPSCKTELKNVVIVQKKNLAKTVVMRTFLSKITRFWVIHLIICKA